MSNQTLPHSLVKFNAQNWPINVQVAFEPWATIPCIRILTYLISRKGKPAFSVRGLGEILSVGKTQLAETLKLLIENDYIVKIGNSYFLNSRIEEVSGKPDSCPEDESLVSGKPDGGVRKTGHNNNKEIIIKNKIPPAPKGELVFPDWVLRNGASALLEEWIAHRKEKRAKLSQRTLNAQLMKFPNFIDLKAAIEHSILNGYIGLFAPPSAKATPSYRSGNNNGNLAPLPQPKLVSGPLPTKTERTEEQKQKDHELMRQKGFKVGGLPRTLK